MNLCIIKKMIFKQNDLIDVVVLFLTTWGHIHLLCWLAKGLMENTTIMSGDCPEPRMMVDWAEA